MKKLNKTTAAALAGAAVTVIGALTTLDTEALGAIQTLLVAALVYFVPNKES
jgi:uncharacterized protein (DUF736 family)